MTHSVNRPGILYELNTHALVNHTCTAMAVLATEGLIEPERSIWWSYFDVVGFLNPSSAERAMSPMAGIK